MAKKDRSVPLTDRSMHILKLQRKAFRKKFGRDPGPGDPIFFDPNADTPQKISRAAIEKDMREVAALLPPDIAYAYLKLDGLLVTESNLHLISSEDLEKWTAAIDEYDQLQKAQEDGGKN